MTWLYVQMRALTLILSNCFVIKKLLLRLGWQVWYLTNSGCSNSRLHAVLMFTDFLPLFQHFVFLLLIFTERQEHSVLVRRRHRARSGNLCSVTSSRNHRRPTPSSKQSSKLSGSFPYLFLSFDRISVLFEDPQKTKNFHNEITRNNHSGNFVWS